MTNNISKTSEKIIRLGKALTTPLYSPETISSVKTGNSTLKKIGLALTETRGKAITYASFITAVCSTLWGLATSHNADDSILSKIKRWSIPVISVLITGLSSYLGYKGYKALNEKSYDLSNKSDQGEIYNKLLLNLKELWEKNDFNKDNLPAELSKQLGNINAPNSSIALEQFGLSLVVDNDKKYLEILPKYCVQNEECLYGLRVHLDDLKDNFSNLNNKFTTQFFIRNISTGVVEYVETYIETTLMRIINEVWPQDSSKSFYNRKLL